MERSEKIKDETGAKSMIDAQLYLSGAMGKKPLLGVFPLPGCTANHPAAVVSSNVTSFNRPTGWHKIWLPIQEHNHEITNVGGYRLPESIPIPDGLTTFSSAICYIESPNNNLRTLAIFFPARQEQRVYEWAQIKPSLLSHLPGSSNLLTAGGIGLLGWSAFSRRSTSHKLPQLTKNTTNIIDSRKPSCAGP